MTVPRSVNPLGRWLRRNAHSVLAALRKSSEETHQELADQLEAKIEYHGIVTRLPPMR